MSRYEKKTLANGLRLVTAPMPEAQSVSCFFMFAAGSRYETRETNGIAHFTEHMLFKGTERRPTARELAGEIDAIGADSNAFTSKEYTGYYIRCAADVAETALDVLVDMVRNSKFDADEIEREKGVILEELNMYLDTPRDLIDNLYEEVLYGDQPLGWMVIGHKDAIQGARRDTFLDYTRRFYTPSRLVIGLGGKFDDALLRQLEEKLGDLGGDGAEGPPPVEVAAEGHPQVRLETKESEQAHLCIGVPSYPLKHPDRYVLHLLATVLGGGMSSRLWTEVRERRGLAYYVFGINHSYTDTGSLYSQAGVDIDRIDDAVTTIRDELRRIADEPVPADELEKARNYAKGRFVLQLESPHGLITFAVRREVLEGQIAEPEEVTAGLDAVTAEDIQRVAREVVAGNGMRLAVIGPFDDAERFEKILG